MNTNTSSAADLSRITTATNTNTTTNTSTATPEVNDPPSLETQIAIFLWKAWPPCLLLLGTFGNIATIFVMRRIKDNHSSQHIILMALAVSDFSLLYVSVLRQWLYFQFQVDVYDWHVLVCKLSWWLIYASGMISSWLLTFVTVQRTMAVTLPHKMRMFCSMQRTYVVIAVIVCFSCVLHSHFAFGMTISLGKCGFSSEGYKDFVKRIWAWVDLTFFTLLPSTCLLVCNVILSFTLFKATSTTVSSSKAQKNASSTTANVSSIRRNTASRTTVMSLSLSCTFLVLTMPVCVYLIWDYYADTHTTLLTRLWTKKILVFAVTMLLWYTNSAVNFLLYCFTGTRFRREFLSWFCCDGAKTGNKPSVSYVSYSSSRFTEDRVDRQQKVK